MWKDFKAFISKGNVMDMAVGVIIATAFGKITSTLVANVIMPLVGLLLGGIDFSTLTATFIGLNGQEVPMQYGLFIQAVVDFFLIALTIFLVMRVLTIRRRRAEAEAAAKKAAEPKKPTTEELLTEIRDLLKEQNK
ncbi:MAG: large-conductance mechanosensitive channel protein MscL [Clostridiales bacterium]|nr:large-conductance mechanosensitive channel protein MscL [Clostridiales bacterium]